MRVASQPQSEGETLGRRQVKRARVQHYDLLDAVGILRHVSHPDYASPVVNDESYPGSDVEIFEQCLEIVDAALKAVFVPAVVRLIRTPAADVVGNDAAVCIAQCEHYITVIKRPGRIAVHHDDWVAFTFVEVMKPQAVAFEVMALERVEIVYHSSPSMRQLRPLPIPRNATFCPA